MNELKSELEKGQTMKSETKKRPETWNGGKLGALLKVGDIITFPYTKIHRITKLEPYTGPLAYLFREGAQIAMFDTGLGMTIDNSDYYA